MAETNVGVRRSGKVLRLVTNGEWAGLFDKTRMVERLRVTVPATAMGRIPTVETVDGTPVQLTRAATPCSCTGYPWNASTRLLREQVVKSVDE